MCTFKKITQKFIVILFLVCAISVGHAQKTFQVEEFKGELIHVVPPVDQSQEELVKSLKERKAKNLRVRSDKKLPAFNSEKNFAKDPALQSEPASKNDNGSNARLAASILNTFTGMSDLEEMSASVPDPIIAVGPSHVVQMVNTQDGFARFQVYTKTGSAVGSYRLLYNLSQVDGAGDPIVLYDQTSDRFFISEMISYFDSNLGRNRYGFVIALSLTNDPSGSWKTWFFEVSERVDYPKYSVWTDAFYGTVNHQGPTGFWDVTGLYAFDKSQMLAGVASPRMQRVMLPASLKARSACPVNLQGTNLPPSNTGGLFAVMADDSWTSSTADRDSIGLYEYKVNFSNSSLSTVQQIASLRVTDFKSNICNDLTNGICIPNTFPGSEVSYDSIQATHMRVMNQPQYRNFGNYEGIVLTHIVDKGSSVSGVRWYELRKSSSSWSVFQQSTFSPDNKNRWLPSIAYDAAGNIALGYNRIDPSTFYVSIVYTGRKACDALNTMTYAESTIASAAANHYNRRYGDYNSMVADPNGNSFWFTAEYNGAPVWSTWIANFTLDNCSVSCTAPSSLTSSSITGSSAVLGWASVSGAVSYTVQYKSSVSSMWNTAAAASTSTSYTLTGLAGATSYDWRVKANCSTGSSAYTQATFTTSGTGCINNYEPNDSRATAVAITPNTTISSMISSASDNDYFKFNNSSSAKNIRVTLSNLPQDYDLEMYKLGSNSVTKSSRHSGLGNEVFYYNTSTISQYEVRVYSRSGGFSATNCYNLKVELSNTNYSSLTRLPGELSAEEEPNGLTVFPVPADDKLVLTFKAGAEGKAILHIFHNDGRLVMNQSLNVVEGMNEHTLNTKDIPSGFYLLKLEYEGTHKTQTIILEH